MSISGSIPTLVTLLEYPDKRVPSLLAMSTTNGSEISFKYRISRFLALSCKWLTIDEFKCDKIFIPKGYDGIDILSGIMKDHKSFRGNSVLLQVIDKYVYIGSEIYEFKPSDEIIEYYSQVGYNDVPYPVAIGKENMYFMLYKTYVPIKYFEGLKKIDFIDAYGHYYGKLKNYAKKMKGVKMIHKRV